MFGFGKKKISEEDATDSFVCALIDDMQEAYPWLIDQLKEIQGGDKISSLPENARETIITAALSLELIALSNLFPEDQAKRIRELSISLFAEYQEVKEETLCFDIESYERCFNEHTEAHLNPLLAVSELLIQKLGIEDPRLKGPDPILASGLSAALVSLSGRWKRLNESFKITKSKT